MAVLGRRFAAGLGGGYRLGSRTCGRLDGCRRRLGHGAGILVRTLTCLFRGWGGEGGTVDVIEHVAACDEEDWEGLGDGAAWGGVIRHDGGAGPCSFEC